MAHCINCDVLISDRPEHGDFCSEECASEYRAGADPARLAASDIDKLVNTVDNLANNADADDKKVK